MEAFQMSSHEVKKSPDWNNSFTMSHVNHYETSSNGDEDDMHDKLFHSEVGHSFIQKNNRSEDEAKIKEQTSDSESSDEDGEIETEKSYRKLVSLHAGIGHCLGQINRNESDSMSQKKTGNMEIDGKRCEEPVTEKCDDPKEETASDEVCQKVEDSEETDSIVSKIGTAFSNMWNWLYPGKQTFKNEPFKSKMSVKTKRTARLVSHPYKSTARRFHRHCLLGPTILAPEMARSGLRPVVIDGFNVAMCHGRALAKGGRAKFSGRGIEMCVEFFLRRGHETVVAFLPQHAMAMDRDLLAKMEKDGNVVFTPSRKVGGRRISSYDDRFIVEFAHHHGGVIVTRDNYADLYEENPEWRQTIEDMVLMPTWVGDTLMFPADPQGKEGPTLDQLLRN